MAFDDSALAREIPMAETVHLIMHFYGIMASLLMHPSLLWHIFTHSVCNHEDEKNPICKSDVDKSKISL